jgi:putative tricarboxylic transport membrane protein
MTFSPTGKLAGAALLGAALASAPAMALDSLKIMAPAAPGGGWDQTARTIQATLQAEGLVSNIQVENVAGAGGTIGLQQFVNASTGDPTSTIVGGYVMVGAIIANESPVGLDDVTPLARLTGEYVIVVVPEGSPIQDADDLAEQLRADPGSVTWAAAPPAASITSRPASSPARRASIRRSSTTSPMRAAARRWRPSWAIR